MHRDLFRVLVFGVLLACGSLAFSAPSQRSSLPADRAKSGALILSAFKPVSASVRESVVRFDLNGKPVALGAIVDATGLAVTKASEIGEGALACTLPDGRTVVASLILADEDNDLALVKIEASALRPIRWAENEVAVGQWAVTPGIDSVPEAVGIVSTQSRRILPKRAIIGVRPDFNAPAARIFEVMAGFGAEKAGLKSGDIIIAVNEVLVKNAEELVKALREFREGQTVTLRVNRDQEELEVVAELQAEPTGRGVDRNERMNRFGGELSRRAEGFQLAIQHDTVLQPWQCGGPLLNLSGEAVGLNIARAGRIASYALPAALVRQLIDNLVKETGIHVGHDASEQPRPAEEN